MFSENLSVGHQLPERMEKAFHNPVHQQNPAKTDKQTLNKTLFCEFYSKLPCTLPYAIYPACRRCSRAFLKQGIKPYEPKVDTRDIYEKIVSLSFFFTEQKNPAV